MGPPLWADVFTLKMVNTAVPRTVPLTNPDRTGVRVRTSIQAVPPAVVEISKLETPRMAWTRDHHDGDVFASGLQQMPHRGLRAFVSHYCY